MSTLRWYFSVSLVMLTVGVSTAPAADKLQGDPAQAKPIVVDRCAVCHGEDGNSPVPNFPNLAGQHVEYLFRELNEFKTNSRLNEAMPPAFLEDFKDSDMANLAFYFASQKPKPASVTKPELLEFGKQIYLNGNPDTGVPSCDGCHEEDGNGSARFPRIAGQNVEYILETFKSYTANKRKNCIKQMRAVASRLSEKEIEALAQYLASMK